MRTIEPGIVAVVWLAGCGGPGIYEPCGEPEECEVPGGVEAECVDAGAEEPGFCTWSCEEDADCSDPAEDERIVCASFESSEGKHCFPSCEGVEDEEEACPPDFECRSTGGGNENRKVCFPSG